MGYRAAATGILVSLSAAKAGLASALRQQTTGMVMRCASTAPVLCGEYDRKTFKGKVSLCTSTWCARCCCSSMLDPVVGCCCGAEVCRNLWFEQAERQQQASNQNTKLAYTTSSMAVTSWVATLFVAATGIDAHPASSRQQRATPGCMTIYLQHTPALAG